MSTIVVNAICLMSDLFTFHLNINESVREIKNDQERVNPKWLA